MGFLAFINIFDHIRVKSWEDSPECFPLLHVRNATPAPGWFQPQEKCLNRQQLAGFPLFPQKYQTNSDKEIKMEFPMAFAQLISSFEAGLDLTENKTLGEVERPCKFIWVKFGCQNHKVMWHYSAFSTTYTWSFLQISSLLQCLSISPHPFFSLIRKISSKSAHFLFPSGFIHATTYVHQQQTAA